MFGYAGSILTVDLTNGTASRSPLSADLRRRFIGGRGFGAKLLYDRLPRGVEAFSPENPVILATGPLTGSPAGGSKMTVVSKSPATEGWGDSHVGGQIGPALRHAGQDVLVLVGRASGPTQVLVEDGQVHLLDAKALWGAGTFETERTILAESGPETQTICIGPAGEKLARMACLSHDFGRQAGRCGLGAVLGAKGVKAVSFRGGRSIPLAEPGRFLDLCLAVIGQIRNSPRALEWRELGTALHLEHAAETGSLPTRNYQEATFDGADQIDALAVRSNLVERDKACFGCPMVCGKYSVVADGPYAGTRIDGPEYEILSMLGSNCGIADLSAIVKANHMADDLGLDAISAGNLIAFAMECAERGILSREELGGRELTFGDVEGYLELLGKIGRREEIGDLLAEGVQRAAAKLGKGADELAMHSKGLEHSGYNSRAGIAMALGYSVNDRGADHNRMWSASWLQGAGKDSLEGKAEELRAAQCLRSAPDILGICRFLTDQLELEQFADLLSAAVGEEVSAGSVLTAAERIFNLTRLFNYREGHTEAGDDAPARVFRRSKGRGIDRKAYDALRKEFYSVSGWDPGGMPTAATLARLDLTELVPEAERLGRGPNVPK